MACLRDRSSKIESKLERITRDARRRCTVDRDSHPRTLWLDPIVRRFEVMSW